jgi:hypothetical protein
LAAFVDLPFQTGPRTDKFGPRGRLG